MDQQGSANTGSYIQYLVINHNGKEYEKEYMYVYMYNRVTLLYSINEHNSVIQLYFNKIRFLKCL